MMIIYIADDHLIVANGIASMLQQLDEVAEVAVFPNGECLFREVVAKLPDLVFLDYSMPGWDGQRTLTEIKERYPQVRVIMLSMLDEKAVIEACIQQGADGFLNKDCTVHELKEAVFSKELPYFSKSALKVLSNVSSMRGAGNNLPMEPLSEREKEILMLLCEGFSPKEIADKIFLSPRTVETHKFNIMQKFGVSSVGKLISLAIKNKVV